MSIRLLRPARWLTFLLGITLSLAAVYSYIYTFQMVFGDPALVLPDEKLWTATQLANVLAGLGLPGNFYAVYMLGVTLLFGLSFLVCGWLILLRRSQDWFGMYLSLLLLSWCKRSRRILFDAELSLDRGQLCELVYVARFVFVIIFFPQWAHRPALGALVRVGLDYILCLYVHNGYPGCLTGEFFIHYPRNIRRPAGRRLCPDLPLPASSHTGAPADQAGGVFAGALAVLSTGDILLFLHADCLLPDNADRLIIEGMNDRHRLWGRFDVKFSGRHPLLRVIEFLMNWRSRLSCIATGDQGIFVERNLFEKIGGFPEIDLMEDIALCKLKKYGRPLCLRQRIMTSSRRWEEKGLFRTVLLMWFLRFAYFFRADPKRLVKLYYR